MLSMEDGDQEEDDNEADEKNDEYEEFNTSNQRYTKDLSPSLIHFASLNPDRVGSWLTHSSEAQTQIWFPSSVLFIAHALTSLDGDGDGSRG
ncbi:uncharacterized protein G2W53_009985 [Senna tora]|uniref:Uncharacterized protein n=1 Tax=Senna tora TaxID=362788 RepID=A0A835CAT3_9FABA|nr:uncharacterized protein G2W53_009985 [Senna tora]